MQALIVDDDAVTRRLLENILKEHGECVHAATAEDGLTLFQAARAKGKPFDLIILDILLPGMRGSHLLRSIRDEESKEKPALTPAKIIMLTGTADSAEINDLRSLGIASYLLKPIDRTKLVQNLQRLDLVADPNDEWG